MKDFDSWLETYNEAPKIENFRTWCEWWYAYTRWKIANRK